MDKTKLRPSDRGGGYSSPAWGEVPIRAVEGECDGGVCHPDLSDHSVVESCVRMHKNTARRRGDDGGQRQVVMNFILFLKGTVCANHPLYFFGRRRDILRGGLPPQRLTPQLTVGPLSRGLP